MAVFQVKKYKIIKDENGSKVQVQKTKEEWNKETRKGTMTWYFSTRYKINNQIKQYKSPLYTLKREAEDEERLFLNNPTEYIQNHSKKAKNNMIFNIQPNNFEKTLGEYFKDFLIYESDYIKEATIYDYECIWNNHLRESFGSLLPYELDLIKSQNWKNEMNIKEKNGKKYSIRTKNKSLTTFSEFCKYLVSIGMIDMNYAKNIGNFKNPNVIKNTKKKIKYQTIEQFNFFMNCVDDVFWYSFFNFAFWHGCRIGEQRALRIKDINLNKNTIHFHETFSKSKNGSEIIGSIKNGKERTIFLAKQSKPYIEKIINFYKQMDNYSDEWFLFGGFANTYKNRIERALKNYYCILQNKYPDNNINDLTHHEFGRHSHASYLLNIGIQKGLHIEEIYAIIAERLGDTIEVIKETYAHLYQEEYKDKVINILD